MNTYGNNDLSLCAVYLYPRWGKMTDIDLQQWRTEGGVGGGSNPPKFRSFEKVEPGCKLSGKCLVFLFQHAN